MKKLIALVMIACTAMIGYAQQNQNEDKNIIYVEIPKKLKIEDKIILYNNTTYTLLQGVVAEVTPSGLKNLGQVTHVRPDFSSLVTEFDDEKLKEYRGKKLAIKIKGIKNIVANDGTVSGDPNTVTYNFSVTPSERNHDLILTVTSDHNSFDF
jgi:hypothetical protein